MAKELSNIAVDLFNKIRSRFSHITIGDETSAKTTDPDQARFFDFDFKVNNEVIGRINLALQNDRIIILYNDSMLTNQSESNSRVWFQFLKEIREFARSNLLKFDARDITKSNLDQRDYSYLSKQNGDKKMSESKLFGSNKTSYQNMGEAKIIVKHSQPVNYASAAGRSQHIDSIYIESAQGERFKYPYKHLNGARAMAVHVAAGGNLYDSIGNYITGLSEELAELRRFKNYTKKSGVVSESLGSITEHVIDRIDNIKNEIGQLQKPVHYQTFAEAFEPKALVDIPESTIQEWTDALTIKTFNEELKSVFPFIYRLVSEKNSLSYDDLVTESALEEPVCLDCEKDPCECESEDAVKEHPLMVNFENTMDEIASEDYSMSNKPESHDCGCDENTENPCEDCQKSMDNDNISKEIVEYIASMYDRETGTFPRGETGVKLAVEKKFGESSGKFASYAVERLSARMNPSDTFISDDSQSPSPELDRIKKLSGF